MISNVLVMILWSVYLVTGLIVGATISKNTGSSWRSVKANVRDFGNQEGVVNLILYLPLWPIPALIDFLLIRRYGKKS